MRKAMFTSLALNLVLAVASYLICPPQVALHFTAADQPDSWGPSYVFALVSAIPSLIIFAIFIFIPKLTRNMPASMINLPNKEYWMNQENIDKTQTIITSYFYAFGTATLVFMFVICTLAIEANLSQPVHLRENFILYFTGLFLIFTACWSVKLILAFRLPKDKLD